MKRTVSFFLASSITDLQTDRKEIGDFINQLNNIYERDGMFIRLIKCEDESMNHSIVVGGTQKTLDELIEESDLCFVLFWHRAGAMTVHELEVAYSAFKAKESPKVIIYFKTVKESDDIQDDLRRVMDRIHFWPIPDETNTDEPTSAFDYQIVINSAEEMLDVLLKQGGNWAANCFKGLIQLHKSGINDETLESLEKSFRVEQGINDAQQSQPVELVRGLCLGCLLRTSP